MNFRVAIASIGMTPRNYLLRVMLPLVVITIAVPVALQWVRPTEMMGPVSGILWLVPLLVTALLVYYPFLRAAELRAEVDRNIHFFITHLGVLATSSLPRAEIFRLLGDKREYGVIARESRRISTLVTKWGLSLADAARFVGARSPSRIFSDFLARLAHAIDSGEDLPGFLHQEQTTVMNDFANTYRRSLYAAEMFKSVFSGLVMSVSFLFIFSMLLPALTGMSTVLVLGGALIGALLLDASLVQAARTRAPHDPIWHFARGGHGSWRAFRLQLVITAAALLVAVGLVVLTRPSPGIAVATTLTPLAYLGWHATRLESSLVRREENYGAFVRSLGASAAAQGGQARPVLKQLQYHDFGPLRRDVRSLYRRLSLRADDARAWESFGAESDSHLVLFFNRMFQEGLAYGGKADEIGALMSDNFARLVALRKERYQSALTFRGAAFGLVIALAAALTVGVGTVKVLAATLSGFDEGSVEGVPLPIPSFEGLNFGFVSMAVVIAVFAHALTSALIVGILRGSHPARSALDLVIFAWVGIVVTMIGERLFVFV